ncbi:hypothetical protein SLE2022_242360 [Rubroshorea leprosula]
MEWKRAGSLCKAPLSVSTVMQEKPQSEQRRGAMDLADVDIDLREVYLLIVQFLSAGPCKRSFEHLLNELLENQLLPRRYHAWFSRSGMRSGNDDDVDEDDDGISLPLSYDKLVERYPHIEKDHLVKLLKQLLTKDGGDARAPKAASVPTLLGYGSFSLLDSDRTTKNRQGKSVPIYLRWPHMQADQVRGLSLREIGGGFAKHHRASSIRSACYAIAKPSTMVQKMQNIMKLRGHRNAVYCAIFDRSGRYFITGSDDRLVKIWSMETAFCLASCRGHEGDITDLAVSSNNALVASASNDFVIRVWRLPDGAQISVLRGHTGAVTAIAFSPRPTSVYQLLSSSDDGTCRIWDARYSQCSPQIYLPKPPDAVNGKSNYPSTNGPSASNAPQTHQILCCAYNANGTVFVTGSSDTFARVWVACKPSADDLEQPIHELDVLAGHENDVNYVQFSGCAVPSRSSMSDIMKEENVPKFKNSWFCHDNIVTCSRDGSAIIWIPKSRRSHGKVGRWTKAYHLKVPPPPLPPQPPRGGPRQRLLPTPRGVNMIVWSLDNRFVLAAIMDCRICVWNAVDGSLVHSLTGHSLSSYVLDVHPFNPRIAMSAGYDGKTIIWDIWEGVPIRIYEIGRFKLVDGKFSPDGTSIVLSDEVGQIHLLNTGQGESQKDAKYDQFFLGDYRPLARDAAGNVLDQETQLPPHKRNMQDPLCDSSLIPYPEPYQSMYQRRRLGALGIEWRPTSTKFAIGPDINLGQDFEMPPLEDLERIIEPPPEFIDAMYWEPENEVMSDDNDSEYDVTGECSTEGERGTLCSSSSSDAECREEDGEVELSHKDGFRRSRRRKHEAEVELMTASGRRVKKRSLNEHDGSTSGINRIKKSKNGRKSSKRKSSKEKPFRPQRLAARNARNMFSKITGTSTEEDDEVESEDYSSNSESGLQDSSVQSIKTDRNLENMPQKPRTNEQILFDYEDGVRPHELNESQSNIGNRKKLILKFSLRDSKKQEPPGDNKLNTDDKTEPSPPSEAQETSEEKSGILGSKDPGLSCGDAVDAELSSQVRIDWEDTKRAVKTEDHFVEFAGGKELGIEGEKSKNHMFNGQGEHLRTDSFGDPNYLKMAEFAPSNHQSCELKENAPIKLTKLRIRTKAISSDLENPSKLKPITVAHDLSIKEGDLISNRASYADQSPDFVVQEKVEGSDRSSSQLQHSDMEANALNSISNQTEGVANALRRTRSMKMKSITQQPIAWQLNSKGLGHHASVGTSQNAGSSSMYSRNQLVSEEWMASSKGTMRSRSSRKAQDVYHENKSGFLNERKLNYADRKLSWLMLPEHEEGYRYIPQLGDEVVYFRQGHEACIVCLKERGPWHSVKGYLSAVEICKVEKLSYANFPGSGESCCKITLRFVDTSSGVFGKAFELTLPELIGFPDFLVEKTRYDAAMSRQWSPRDKCLVWWKNDNGDGGSWWEGRIISSQAKSMDFPDSPWERYEVRYKDGNTYPHSAWELHDPAFSWEHPHVDPGIKDKLLSAFAKLDRSIRKQDYYGIEKLNEAAQKSEFLNRFAVPLYPDLIRLRLENNYYRTFEAVENDIREMLSNAESFFGRTAYIKRLSEWFSEKLSNLKQVVCANYD